MAFLIMNDIVDYEGMWYPTHIVSKDNSPIPVYLGAAKTLLNGFIGIYIKDEDYEKIRHDKAYIFIHNPEIDTEEIENIDWEKIPDCGDESSRTNREHMHIWKDEDFIEYRQRIGIE